MAANTYAEAIELHLRLEDTQIDKEGLEDLRIVYERYSQTLRCVSVSVRSKLATAVPGPVIAEKHKNDLQWIARTRAEEEKSFKSWIIDRKYI